MMMMRYEKNVVQERNGEWVQFYLCLYYEKEHEINDRKTKNSLPLRLLHIHDNK